MSEHMLVHLNVVRPVGAFSIDHPNAQFFFRQLPLVFAQARADDDLLWHNHGARMPDGSYTDTNGIIGHTSDRTEDNIHILTMAGWRDLAAMHRFTYREPLHRAGMKTLRNWVDRSEGSTMVMWWAPRGTRVSLEAAWDKMQMLRNDGPGPDAFTLQQRFDPPA